MRTAATVGAPTGVVHIRPGSGAPAGPTDPAKKEVPAPIGPKDVNQTFQNQATNGSLAIDFKSGWGYVIDDLPGCCAHWYVHVWNDGTRRFQHVQELKCMVGGTTEVWPTISPIDCDSSTSQSWFIKHWNDGTIEIRNQASGKCLQDAGGGYVNLGTCNASREQSWY